MRPKPPSLPPAVPRALQRLGGLVSAQVVNATVAAGLAWLVVRPWGGAMDKYAYYAPLGAVMAVSGTLVNTVRGSIQTLVAIGVGAVLGSGVLHLPLPDVVGVMVIVAIGTWLGGVERLGGRGSWVAWSGIFILVVGQSDPVKYGASYAGFTALGALIGIAVNALAPPLPLAASAAAVARLQSTLADQFEDLADGLDRTDPLAPEDWDRRRHDLGPLAAQMDDTLGWAAEARRANWRARRWRERWARQRRLALALREMYLLLTHLREVLMAGENAAVDELALGGSLRPYTASLLRSVAGLLRAAPDDEEEVARTRADADRALSELVEEVRRERRTSSADFFAAGAVITVLRRAIAALDQAAADEGGDEDGRTGHPAGATGDVSGDRPRSAAR